VGRENDGHHSSENPKENIIHSSTFASEENRCGGGECQTINGWNESHMVHSTTTNSYWVTCHDLEQTKHTTTNWTLIWAFPFWEPNMAAYASFDPFNGGMAWHDMTKPC